MDPERWSRINEVFFAALEQPTDERPRIPRASLRGRHRASGRGRAAAGGGPDGRVSSVSWLDGLAHDRGRCLRRGRSKAR